MIFLHALATIISTLLSAILIAVCLVAGVLILLGLLNLTITITRTLWRGHL